MKEKLLLPMPMYFSFIILKSIHLLCCHLSSSYSVAVALVGWLSAKFQFLPHDVFIKTRQNRVEVHGNIKTCYGFSERLEYPANKLRSFSKIRLNKNMERSQK